MSKKPKLDICKNVNLLTQDMVKNTNHGDLFDELWGEDLDSSEVEKVEFVETLALSQIPEPTQMTNFSTAVQINQAVESRGIENSNFDCFVRANASSNVKSSPRVPLRRVASSQWPSSHTFSSSSSNSGGFSPSVVHRTGHGTKNGLLQQSVLDELVLEKKKLKEEINSKTGEIKILREKLYSAQKEMDTLKVERSSLLKGKKSLQGQLDVKNMELETAERKAQHSSLLKRVHPDSPNSKHRPASRKITGVSATTPAVSALCARTTPGLRVYCCRCPPKENTLAYEFERSLIKTKRQTLPLQYIRQCVAPELFEPSLPEAPISESVRSSNPRLFSGLIESSRRDLSAPGPSTSRSAEYLTARSDVSVAARRELRVSPTSITRCASLLHSPDLVDITSNRAHQVISQVVDICYHILMEQTRLLESALCSNSRFIERERELLQNGCRQMPLDRDYKLLSHKELYSDERGIQARRALGLLSLLVEASDFAAEKILSRRNDQSGKKATGTGLQNTNELPRRLVTPSSASPDSSDILDVLRSVVCHIEKQRRTFMFQGVLAGTTILLKNLLEAELVVSQENQTKIVDILRWVVSARPGNFIIRNILQMLLAATRHLSIITALCHNSAEETCQQNRRRSLIQFSPDSCILQILCWQVQIAETPKKQVLSDAFMAWVLSLFCGGQPRPPWINCASVSKACQCQPLVVKLSFHLLSEACFMYPRATGYDKKHLESVLVRGVLLVHTFMNDGDHLLANVDPSGFSCYEHFLHTMNYFIETAEIKLDKYSSDIWELLCMKEVQRQPANTVTDTQTQQLDAILSSFHIGENGIKCPNVIDYIHSL